MPHTSCSHTCTASPVTNIPHQSGPFLLTDEPALTHHYHAKIIVDITVQSWCVHSVGLGTCVLTCSPHHLFWKLSNPLDLCAHTHPPAPDFQNLPFRHHQNLPALHHVFSRPSSLLSKRTANSELTWARVRRGNVKQNKAITVQSKLTF